MDNVDFLPERIRNQRARRRRLVRQTYLLLICAAGLVALGYFRQGRIREASAQVALLAQCEDSVKRQTARRAVLEEQLKDLSVKKQVEHTLGSSISAQLVLAELQRQLPPTVCLTKLELESVEVLGPDAADVHTSVRAAMAGAAPRPKPGAPKRVHLVFTGLAPGDVDVANFIGQLAASPLFEDVNMGYAKNVVVKGRNAREFCASCYVSR
ncbi:MAG: PilN domain-containing protein [Phycisphaerae bacterium]